MVQKAYFKLKPSAWVYTAKKSDIAGRTRKCKGISEIYVVVSIFQRNELKDAFDTRDSRVETPQTYLLILLLQLFNLHSKEQLSFPQFLGIKHRNLQNQPENFQSVCRSHFFVTSVVNISAITMDYGQMIFIGVTSSVVLTAIFSLWLLTQHLSNWKKPAEQKAIVIIILMAPLYAGISYIGLLEFMASSTFFLFLESIKECYEALVISKFLSLLYSYLNISISKNIVPDEIKGREIHHTFPMTLFQPHSARLNHHTLKLLKNWTYQFVVIRPVCSILMIALQLIDVYPSWLSWTFTIILNVSVSLALYSLVVFYHVFDKELKPHSPLAKFLCIKGIVFFCFWQGIVLEMLAAVGIIKAEHAWFDVEHINEALQNTLVCVEMVFFAMIQMSAYSASPYKSKSAAKSKVQKKDE